MPKIKDRGQVNNTLPANISLWQAYSGQAVGADDYLYVVDLDFSVTDEEFPDAFST